MSHYGNLERIDKKGDIDLVTAADRASEETIKSIIAANFPRHAIIAEETGASPGEEHTWVIDPLDGTTNYAHGFPWFSVSIAVMRELWTAKKPAFEGRFWRFSGIDAQPRPVQKGGPPIVVGGGSDGAIRRAVALGQGWYGFAMDVATAKQHIDRVRAQERKAGRTDRLEISITPRGGLTAERVREYREIGVDRLMPILPQTTEADALATIEQLAKLQ